MKFRSNSSNKANKKMCEAKTVVKINLLFTVFTETELQINRKFIKG